MQIAMEMKVTKSKQVKQVMDVMAVMQTMKASAWQCILPILKTLHPAQST
jgi:hypothetical protein